MREGHKVCETDRNGRLTLTPGGGVLHPQQVGCGCVIQAYVGSKTYRRWAKNRWEMGDGDGDGLKTDGGWAKTDGRWGMG